MLTGAVTGTTVYSYHHHHYPGQRGGQGGGIDLLSQVRGGGISNIENNVL